MDIYALKKALGEVGAELTKTNSDLAATLGNPSVSRDELSVKEANKADLQARFDSLKGLLEEAEAAEAAKAKAPATSSDPKTALVAAKASFYRSILTGKPIPADVKARMPEIEASIKASLQAIPAGNGTGGENLLPTNLQNEIIVEPLVVNHLREVIQTSTIKGLELPRVLFTLDDDTFIDDDETAKEMEAAGDKVTFGRFKTKVKCAINDSVMNGSDLGLVTEVENALRSGLAAKEKKVSFATAASSTEKHMSFYEQGTEPGSLVIKEVTGASMFDAITNAIADLHEAFRDSATVVMTYTDYVAMIKDLANGSMDLFNAPPEKVIGKPVTFDDRAVIPVVGAYSYCRLNYDGDPTYDSDKDIDSGDYIFVMTAWMDQQRKLNTAFRLAVVEESA